MQRANRTKEIYVLDLKEVKLDSTSMSDISIDIKSLNFLRVFNISFQVISPEGKIYVNKNSLEYLHKFLINKDEVKIFDLSTQDIINIKDLSNVIVLDIEGIKLKENYV